MKIRYLIMSAVILAACNTKEQPDEKTTSTNKTTIAFGSCAIQDSVNLIWDAVATHNPEVFIWLGDNIYGDSEDPNVLAEKYARQKAQVGYQQFLKSGVKVIGTWDDHDYGANDGGKEFPAREESKALMLEFLDVPQDDPVRDYPGVYQQYTFGEEGKRVKIILLDTRWFRDALAPDTTGRGRYMAAAEGSMLGDAQWRWLEDQVRQTDVDVLLVGSSIQAISEEHGFEKWANFPHEQKRLYDLLAQSSAATVAILSGDRHLAEVSRIKIDDKWLYDITSSGMTHVYAQKTIEPNAHRISPLVARRNWGLIEIIWDETPETRVEIRGINDTLYYQHTLGQ